MRQKCSNLKTWSMVKEFVENEMIGSAIGESAKKNRSCFQAFKNQLFSLFQKTTKAVGFFESSFILFWIKLSKKVG